MWPRVETACNTNSGGSSTDPAVNRPNQRELGSSGVDDRRVPDNTVPASRPHIKQIEK
jgi:hypothetical protein